MSATKGLLVLMYGVAALAGQACVIVWMKRLTLVLGMTLPAIGTVLAVSLAGYALGAMAVGRVGRRGWNATRVFAWLQVVLGTWSIAMPYLFNLLEAAYAALAPPAETAGHQAIRVALMLPVLLPPAAAMGAVFPVVSAAGATRAFASGVAGSLAGVLAGSLLFLPAFGIDASLWRLGVVQLVVAVAAWFLAPLPVPATSGPPEYCGRACTAAVVLGASLFLAETVWFQLIWLVVDQSAYAEGLVMGAVFLAMAAGAWGAAIALRPRLPVILAATAVAQVLLIPAMGWLSGTWHVLVRNTSFSSFLALEFLLALWVVGLPSLGYGFAVPRLCEGFGPRAVGRIWSSHYLGGMAAALAGPFLVIPTVGVTVTLGLASAGLALPFVTDRRWGLAALIGIPCVVISALGDATFRRTAEGSERRLLLHHEDGGGLVEVFEHVKDGTRTLHSGRVQQEGGDSRDHVEIERLLGMLPLRLHRPHRRVLVIGLGTGVTAGGMLADREVEKLTCVEISAGILHAARLFAHVNGDLLNDPRVHLVRQDGRNFVRLTEDHFDLIMQELFFPYRAGVGSLYTVEHFRRCRERLAPGGRMAQWISLGQVGPDELRTVVRTFQSVFPHTSLWRIHAYLMMLGGDMPLVPPREGPLRDFVAADGAVAGWSAAASLNTEDNLLIEYRVPMLFSWLNSDALVMSNFHELAEIHQDATVLSPDLPVAPSRGARHLLNGIQAQLEGDPEGAYRELQRAVELDPGNEEARSLLDVERARRTVGGANP